MAWLNKAEDLHALKRSRGSPVQASPSTTVSELDPWLAQEGSGEESLGTSGKCSNSSEDGEGEIVSDRQEKSVGMPWLHSAPAYGAPSPVGAGPPSTRDALRAAGDVIRSRINGCAEGCASGDVGGASRSLPASKGNEIIAPLVASYVGDRRGPEGRACTAHGAKLAEGPSSVVTPAISLAEWQMLSINQLEAISDGWDTRQPTGQPRAFHDQSGDFFPCGAQYAGYLGGRVVGRMSL